MPEYVVELAAAGDAATVGGKGASLGSLARAGAAVPPGFVVTAAAFAAAIKAIDPDGVLRAALETSPAGAPALRERIVTAPLAASVASAIGSGYESLGADADVAVRSSATMEDSSAASFAGLQDTYLGVAGLPSVLDHVRRCWASLYNDESVAYRRRLGMPERDLAMAVVVQRMVRPRAAGVMFTRSPVSGDRSVVAIEGTWGLGSALVAGDVTPDSFVISKITGEITGRRVCPKERLHSFIPNGRGVTVTATPDSLRGVPCLTDEEIRALASAARQVEAHYGVPQDIEWAVLDEPAGAPPGERIVLLQSRPETVWAAKTAPPVAAPKARPADHVLSLFGKPQ
jgi:pyruvate, water dikinase